MEAESLKYVEVEPATVLHVLYQSEWKALREFINSQSPHQTRVQRLVQLINEQHPLAAGFLDAYKIESVLDRLFP